MSFAPLFSREYALLCEELTHLDRTGRVQVPPARPAPPRPARPLRCFCVHAKAASRERRVAAAWRYMLAVPRTSYRVAAAWQTVRREQNEWLYDLLHAVGRYPLRAPKL